MINKILSLTFQNVRLNCFIKLYFAIYNPKIIDKKTTFANAV